MVRLQYNHLSQDSLRETGAGDLSLAADSASYDSWQTTLGMRVSTLFTLDGEFGIEPEVRGGWTRDFGDLTRPISARFYTVPGAAPFVTSGAQVEPDHFFVGTGYLMRVNQVPLVGFDYDFYVGDNYQLHVISAQLYLRW
jgi:outer membrane autotransporter protein